MRLKSLFLSALSIAAAITGFSALAVEPGDAAPELSVSKWLLNGPVKLSDGKGEKVYLIDFWATWCQPSCMSLKHMSALQKRYGAKGLLVAAISSEDEKSVSEFLSKQAPFSCSVGVDSGRATDALYMQDQPEMPAVFLVGKDGRLVWKGHPANLEFILKRYLEGKFSSEDAKRLLTFKGQAVAAIEKKALNELIEATDRLLEINPMDEETVRLRLAIYKERKQDREAIEFLDRLIEIAPSEPSLCFNKLQMLMDRPEAERPQLREFAGGMIERFKDDSETLNNLAWTLVDEADFGDAQLDLALKAATMAVEKLPADVDSTQRGATLDTLARVSYCVGLLDKAVELQEKSAELSKGDADYGPRAQRVLEFYRKARELGKASGQ